MANKFDFSADSITVNGKTFPARYEVTAAAVNVFATVTEDGKEKTVCICIEAGNELYGPAALAAVKEAPEAQQAEEEAQQAEQEAEQAEEEAQQAEEEQQIEEAQHTEEAEQAAQEVEQTAPEAEQAEPEAEQPEEAQQPEEEAEQAAPEVEQVEPEAEQTAPEAEQAAPDPKAARGPVPEKTFIGQSITGAGWAIIFDGAHNRTRVIISKGNHDKLRGIVESAGFYYSASMDSWNRKLTFRAYRAAQALAQELTAACAA